jgi:hypothetical protein
MRRVTGRLVPDVSGQQGNSEMSVTNHLLTRENSPKEQITQIIKTKIKNCFFLSFFMADSAKFN